MVLMPEAAHASTEDPCRSSLHPGIAQRLGEGITTALSGRTGTTSVAVYDRKHALRCEVAADIPYDSASVVKATILGALLRQAQDEERVPTSSEASLAHAMITRSDNAAASALWKSVGRTRLGWFLKRTGMTHTVLGPDRYWGLTQITAWDEIQLLRAFTLPNSVLTGTSRAYALKLLNSVIPAQRWGTTAGAPSGMTSHVKNGWLKRRDLYWRVHSIGAFTDPTDTYLIVVLTRDTPSMHYGVDTIEVVSRAIHHVVHPRSSVASGKRTRSISWESSDGSPTPGS